MEAQSSGQSPRPETDSKINIYIYIYIISKQVYNIVFKLSNAGFRFTVTNDIFYKTKLHFGLLPGFFLGFCLIFFPLNPLSINSCAF